MSPPSRRAHGKPLAALVLAAAVVGVGVWMYGGTGDSALPAQLGGADALCDPEFCGNGQMDPGEQCDDGNKSNSDKCSYPFCQIICEADGDCPSGECVGGVCRELCGNGVVDPPTCVTTGGGFTCPPPAAGDMKMVNLRGGVFPLMHASGDLNKDGKLDIVVANYMGTTGPLSSSLYVGTLEAFINKGNGEFEPRRQIGTFGWNDGGGTRGMDVFDADDDGDADVVVYDQTAGGIVVLRNDNMTFVRVGPVERYFAFHLSHGDVSGDRDPELGMAGFQLGVSGYYSNNVLAGESGVEFGTPSPLGQDGSTGYDTIRFGDMNNDGKTDVVTSSSARVDPFGYAVRVYLNRGDGSLREGVIMYQRAANPNVTMMTLGDVDKDGNLDVVLAENSHDAVVVFGDGNGGSRSQSVLRLPFQPRFVAVADPSRDGKPDIVFGPGLGTEGKNLWYAPGNGNGTFGEPVRFVTVNPPASGRPPLSYNSSYYYNYDLRAADYDGDGYLDLSVVHALSSDSATVILMRASLDECIENPGELTCSQKEECDDGPLNGQPGKCTKRCTYCGNGVIDTVNGIAEACDEGALNGEPGSGCTERCSIDDVRGPKHTECSDRQCVLVDGPGLNTCTSDEHCTRTQRMACTGVGACTIVQGPGMDTCATGADCCDPADPTCIHKQCDFLGETCDDVPGPGLPQCSSNNACAAFHFSCENQQCAIQPGDGPDSCQTAADCAVACNNDGQCSANESCQCLDCFAAPRCNACDQDNVCEAGESCGCGDCAGASSCQTHTTCVDRQCVSVAGPGTNGCTNHAVCERTQHLACTGVGACTIVQGPGMDTCTVATQGADCCDPADPTCDHRQCDFLHQSCEVVRGPARDQCNGDDTCDEMRLACVGEQCALVPGAGVLGCAVAGNCVQQCNNDNICTANESCQCLDCFAAPRCNACDQDNVCEAGESCGCGDCADTSVCEAHTECEDSRCVVKLGPGTNECMDASACTRTQHLACTGVGACTIVQGPGMDTCTVATQGADCCDPADPTCDHRQCNPLLQSCVTVQGPAMDLCAGDDCTAFHSVCRNERCEMVAGPGVSECLDSVMCIPLDCGNGVVDPGEQCDDGNNNNDDTCTNVCESRCGNGIMEEGEDCDEGPGNRTSPPENLAEWYCRALSCTRSVCFDGGDNDGDQLADDIDAGCWRYDVEGARGRRRNGGLLGFLIGQQGNVLGPLIPEVFLAGKGDEGCPAGTLDRGVQCLLLCEQGDICPTGDPCPADGVCPATCGNQIIDLDLGEECDDGNLNDGDACRNNCRLPPCEGSNCPRCGDGIFHPSLGEQCDTAGASATCTANCRTPCDGDEDCAGTCDLAVGACRPPVCGDGETNQDWERCDDGNIDDTDACNNQCQPTCKGDADCESGRCNQARQVCLPTCGNGRYDAGEQCDDGNMINNDSCSNKCERSCTDDSTCDCDEERGFCRPTCGNGRLDPGEGCDDANDDDRDSCSNRCMLRCRPGTICPDNQACPQNGLCQPPAFCGDGVLHATEQCDDGNNIDTDACTNACRVRCDQNLECPSGLLCLGQECAECSSSLQCDDGFCVDGRCRQALPICGNGVVEPGEACDDANGDENDACTSSCLFPRDHACIAAGQCQTRRCEAGTCQPCADAGQCASGLRCAQGNCLFGPEQCGDGIVQAGEACDDANLNEQDECTTACLRPFGESCDHASQCASTICSGGACTPCRGDNECSGGRRCAIGLCLTDAQMALLPNLCGNGVLEAGEACDDGNNRYGDGCTPGCSIGNAPTRAEVAANVTVQLPFAQGPFGGEWGGGQGPLRGAAGDDLSDTGPAAVAIMAAGAAAGTAWVRRRRSAKRS